MSGFHLCPCQVFGDGPAIEGGSNTGAGSAPCGMAVSLLPIKNWDGVRISSVSISILR